jgi:signal transduction histidine kinase/ActR/RegA family two-component response regulator
MDSILALGPEALETLAGGFDVVLDAVNATIWVTDRDLRCRFSRGVVPLRSELTHAQMVGLGAEEYLGPDMLPCLPLLRAALEDKSSSITTARRPTGEEFDVFVGPLRDASGSAIVGVVGVMIDVTERNHALRERESRLELIMSQVPAFLWTTDGDLRVTELLGAAARAEHLTPVGTTIRDFWQENDPNGAIVAHERALEGASVEDESTASGRTLSSHLEPLRSAQGEITGVLGVALDVTRERQLQHQLAQAQKMEAVGRLASGITHDFNNMLTVISGYTGVARSLVDGDPELERCLGEIARAVAASARLTQQLLAFGRQQVVQPQPADLNEIVVRTVDMVARVLADDVVVEQRLAAGLEPVYADPGQLEQMIANLALNARDAMPAGGRLEIRTEAAAVGAEEAAAIGVSAPGAYALLEVRDTGVGMDAATREHLFEPFYTTKSTGTGLGLATVHGTVAQSGGGILVESEPGAGSRFLVYLPFAVESAVDSTLAPQQTRSPEGQLSILVVEADRAVRTLCERFLAQFGHEVVAAATPTEAFSVASGRRFDVVVCDWALADMTGLDVAERVVQEGEALGVVLTSGRTRVAGDDEDAGRDAVLLAKPFDAPALAAAVAEAAGRARQRDP